MSIEYLTRLVCDGCQESLRLPGRSELAAHTLADRKRWRTVTLHPCGIYAHFCPACAKGKTEAELVEKATEGKQ